MNASLRAAIPAVATALLLRSVLASSLDWQPFDWIPARFESHTLDRAALAVRVRLEGLPGEHLLQLDLGATRSVLHGGAVPDLGAAAVLTGNSTTVSGTIAGVPVEDLTVGVLPGFRATLTKGQPLPVIGTLGLDFFQHRILVLDFPRRRFAVLPGGADLPQEVVAGITYLDAELRNGKLYVPVAFDGATQRGFFFDTGASAFAMVTSVDEWTRLTGRRRDDPSNVRVTGSSWEDEATFVGAPMSGTLGAGPASLVSPTVWFADDPRFSFANWPATRGMVGNELFAGQAIVVVDLPRRRFGVLLKP